MNERTKRFFGGCNVINLIKEREKRFNFGVSLLMVENIILYFEALYADIKCLGEFRIIFMIFKENSNEKI